MMAATCRILSKRLLCKYNKSCICIGSQSRTILSDAYYCKDEWTNRLQTSILQKVNIEEYAVKLQDKFDREGVIAAVDMDILVNKLSKIPRKQLDFAQALLYKYRHTNECLLSPPSTPHAVVRELLALGEYSRLWTILKDKINYGIFLDSFTANLLMDHFIKKNLYAEAAYVAYDQMLQEDFSHPIVHALSWYSCHMRWKDLETSAALETEAAAEEEKTEENEEEEEEEEKIIKVGFITNFWYDDHFDIPKESMLLGKTLITVSRSQHNVMGRSYQLIGWGLYEKFDRGLDEMAKWAESDEKEAVCQDALTSFQQRLSTIDTQEVPEPKDPGLMKLEDFYPYITEEQKIAYVHQFQELQDKLQTQGKVVESYDLENELDKFVKNTVSQFENADVSKQIELYDLWNTNRETMVEEQIEKLKWLMREQALKTRLEDLRDKELRLTFFENWNKIRYMKKRGRKVEELEKLFQTEEFVHWAPRNLRK